MMKNVNLNSFLDPPPKLQGRRASISVLSDKCKRLSVSTPLLLQTSSEAPTTWKPVKPPPPNASPIPHTLQHAQGLLLEEKPFATPKILNLSYSLSPINFRHLSLGKRKTTSTVSVEMTQTGSLHNMWGHARKCGQQPSAQLVLNENIETNRVYGLDRCFVDGKGFSRFLKQQAQQLCDDYTKDMESQSATTTPAAPSSDLVGSYNNDTNRLPSSDDLRIGSNGGGSLSERYRNLDFDRQGGQGRDRRSLCINTKGYLDNESDCHDRASQPREDVVLPSTNTRPNYFKPTGLRNNYLGVQPNSTSQSMQRNPPPPINNHTVTANGTSPALRDSDDLVAMGTNWNPGAAQSHRGHNGRPTSLGNSSSGYSISQNGTGCLGGSLSTSVSKRIGPKTNIAAQGANSKLGIEPKYNDPLIGAPVSMQQRILEIGALESETIRWEKSRKMKKKISKDA